MKSMQNASTTALLAIIFIATRALDTKAFVVSPRRMAPSSRQSNQQGTPSGINPTPRDNTRLPSQLDNGIGDDLKVIGSSVRDLASKLGEKFVNVASAGFNRLKEIIVAPRESSSYKDSTFDTEDEELFRALSQRSREESKELKELEEEESKMIIHPEVMEGIRVVGVPGPVVDAEILSKTLSPPIA